MPVPDPEAATVSVAADDVAEPALLATTQRNRMPLIATEVAPVL